MNTRAYDALMWRALRGALGVRKTAALRYLPLSTLITSKLASEGVATTDTLSLGTAAGHAGRKLAMARREQHVIQAGLAALRDLQPAEKTASQCPAIDTQGLYEKVAHAYKLQLVRPYTSPEVQQEVKTAFDQTALEIYDLLHKYAGALQGIPPVNAPARSIEDQAREQAAGVAKIPLLQDALTDDDKVASEDAFQDLLATVYLDWTLRDGEKTAATAQLNREYGTQLLFRALQ